MELYSLLGGALLLGNSAVIFIIAEMFWPAYDVGNIMEENSCSCLNANSEA
ncbi:hypothetical protein SAMN05661044_02626 [Olivibacter domesticus]|uniref:Uncharacterized protein n=1 Tax=Olivibacter domesticus TaxID=407022 RepID=A0A1H7QKB7_OLID1|nr:hypothetical protein SAMN05661044_02626 [Olivibacter domesticus]